MEILGFKILGLRKFAPVWVYCEDSPAEENTKQILKDTKTGDTSLPRKAKGNRAKTNYTRSGYLCRQAAASRF